MKTHNPPPQNQGLPDQGSRLSTSLSIPAREVGDRLLIARLRQRLSQRDVAAALDCTQQAVSLAERGRCGAGLRIRFADLVGVKLTTAEALARRQAGGP
jgi:DNA-binding XRE family transcriptional regulator